MEKIIEAALKMIQPQMIVDFGGGSNVGKLLTAVSEKKMDITVCTPSEETAKKCRKLGIKVTPLDAISQIDIGFDGCDSITYDLTALKSKGGIHTMEKLYAQLAQRYVILAPKERMHDNLNPEIPLTLEVIQPATSQVIKKVIEIGGKASLRADFTTVNNAKLVDCYFDDFSQIQHNNQILAQQNGVIGTSYFEDLITDALITDTKEVTHYQRRD